MTAPDFRAEVARADAENDAAWGRLLRELARRLPNPACGDTITTSRENRTCTHPAGHIGLHRDASGCSWGSTDA
jgi:hypothetical protein